MRRSRLILLISGGVLLLLTLTIGAVVAGGLIVTATAERYVGPRSSELTVEQIEELSSVELPAGSEVLDSEYQSALDWNMTATVRLPAGSSAPVLDPDLVWDGSTIGPDGVVREATTTAESGRLVVEIHAFTV